MRIELVEHIDSHIFPQTGLSCRGPGGELEAGRGCTGRRTILRARFVCVFTVFERSRFTTLQRNGGYPHELRARSMKMALVPSKPHLAPPRQPISKMTQKQFFPELSGDLWGVICYHHWYPRTGLVGPDFFFVRDAR